MNNFEALYHTVKTAVDAGRVGTPVFLRCLAHVASDGKTLDAALAEILGATDLWLGGPAQRVFARGGPRSGQITTTAEFARGGTAIVCVAVMIDAVPRVDFLLVGNRGTLVHEGSSDPIPLEAEDLPPITETSGSVMEAVRQSLKTGKPVLVHEEDGR